MTRAEQSAAALGEQPRESVPVTRRDQGSARGVELAVPLEPARGRELELLLLGRRERPFAQREVTDEGMQPQPAVRLLEHEPAPAESSDRQRIGGQSELDRQRRRAPAEHGDVPQQLPNARRLASEHLLREIRIDRAAGLRQALDDLRPGVTGRRAQRLDGQPHRRRPAGGRLVDRLRQRFRCGPQRCDERLRDLVARERERRAVELEHPTLASQPLDRERRLGARGEHDVQRGRRLPADALDQPRRACRGAELVDVVQHEHEIVRQLLLESLAERAGDGVGTRAVRPRRGRSKAPVPAAAQPAAAAPRRSRAPAPPDRRPHP